MTAAVETTMSPIIRRARPGATATLLALATLLLPAGAAFGQAEAPLVPAFTWGEVEGLDGLADGFPVRIIASGPDGIRLLAGTRQRDVKGGGFREDHRIWASPDGVAWMSSSLKGATALHSIAGGPQGFVALGSGNFAGDRLWHSTDGLLWALVKLPKGAQGNLNDVIATADGFVVGGGLSERGNVQRPAVWTSPDGRAWTATRISDLYGWIEGLATTADGGLQALGLGSESKDTFGGPSLGWRQEADGTWSETGAPEGFTLTREMGHAAGRTFVPTAGPSGFGAVTSADGQAWEPATTGLPVTAIYVPAPESVLGLVELRPNPLLVVSSDWMTWAEAPIDALHLSGVGTGLRAAGRFDDGSLVVVTDELVDQKKGTRRDHVWVGAPAP
jgi:hypothetical protein